MAGNGRPVAGNASEPFLPDAIGSECPALFPLSKSLVGVASSPLYEDELRKSCSSPTCSRKEAAKPADTPVTDDTQGRTYADSIPPGAAKCQRGLHGDPEMPETGDCQGEPDVPRTRQSQSGTSHHNSPVVVETQHPRHRVERPHSIAEMAPSEKAAMHHCLNAGEGVGTASRGSSSSHRDLRDEQPEPSPQPIQRSLSAGLQGPREAPAPHPRRSETGAHCPRSGYCGWDTSHCPTLVCKQPMQLLQSNTMTTCRSSSGSSSPTQQLGGGVRICVPSPPHGEGGSEEPCFLGHGGLEDTFAAYCHPLPIPTPAQLLARPPGAEGERPPPHPTLLAFPRLISSVSETGLDAKRMMGCCGPDCREQGRAYAILPRSGGGAQVGEVRVTRETGTMTSRGELRDAAVQTEPRESPPRHVFPKVSLAASEGGGGGGGEGPNGALGGSQKSPIKEVMWDSEGMTWEVYGASVDPEELGLAIQKHLELQIKEKASRVAKLSRQDTISSQQSTRRRTRGFTMGSLRNPTCCARSSTVLD